MQDQELIAVDTEHLIDILTNTFENGYKMGKEGEPFDKDSFRLGFRSMVYEGLIKMREKSISK